MLLIVAVGVLVFVVAPLVLGLALSRARGRQRSRDPDAAVLAELAELRSPSGTPFFSSGDDVMELAERIEDLRRQLPPQKD